MTRGLLKLIVKTPVILSVGSYDGKHERKMLAIRPKATIHAIEACKKNYKYVVRRLKGKAKTYRCAIGPTTGPINFFVMNSEKKEGSSESNSLFEGAVSGKKEVKKYKTKEVQCYTLDDFMKNNRIHYIDLLKLNCEGGEYGIFEADTLEFLNHVDVISASFHAKAPFFNSDVFIQKRKRIYSILEYAGFQIVVGKKRLTHDSHIDTVWRKQ